MSGSSGFFAKNQASLGTLAGLVVALALVYFFVLGNSNSSYPSKMWFYDVGEKSLIKMSSDTLPPVTLSNGNRAVHAYVIECSSGNTEPQVAYVRKHSDAAVEAMKDIKKTGGPASEEQIRVLTAPESEVVASLAMLEAGEWVSLESSEGQAVMTDAAKNACGGGEFAYTIP
ncbi:hypothetical protein HNQ40_000628 [Algisphaera agarilytica]|uniref:Uncharacterized protein n=2 Tax=Algisphaera agarilytica TaxID=1385975 RepID=A0A7X0LJG7_9BACT|nr:hypothetical protein [Algisphaera agarilytica]